MKKKDLPQISVFKKTLVILGILFSLEILALTIMTIFDLTGIGLNTKSQAKAFSFNAKNLKGEDITVSTQAIEELDLLPSSYESLTTTLGTFSPHELTTFLRFGKTTKTSDQTNLTDAYKKLLETNANILIPQTYIDKVLLEKIYDISEQLKEQNRNSEEILPYIAISNDSVIIQKLNQCIQDNIDAYLEGETCTEIVQKITNEDLSPTLSFLTQSLMYTLDTEQKDFNRYVSNNLHMYTLNNSTKSGYTQNENSPYTNSIMLDINAEHLRKLSLISAYLNLLSQDIDIPQEISQEIEEFSTLIDFLSQYSYGTEIPEEIAQLIQNPAINLQSSNTTIGELEPKVAFLIKSMSVNSTIETFVAPIYTFTGTDETPIPSLTFDVNDNNFDEPYDVTPAAQSKGTVRVPIFMYHRIEPVPEGQSSFKSGLYVDPLDFEKQMAYLVKKNYKTITTTEYAELLKTGKNPTQKTVILTFDDGSTGQYTTAYPILKKYGLTGVFYIISQRSGINQAQTKEMSDNGMEIGSHSSRHPDLTKVTDPDQLSSEIISSKYALQSATGKTVSSFCYPGCGYNSTVLSYVGSAGYTTATSCGSKIDNYPAHIYTLSRVHAFGDMQSFKNLLSGQPGW